MATKAKTGKTKTDKGRKASKEPTIYIEGARRVPAIDVIAPPMYYRLPRRLRSPNTSQAVIGERLYQPIYNAALETVQEDWWKNKPKPLAERYLSAAFSGNFIPQALGARSRFMTVSNIGSPSSWTPTQRQAWADYERAVQQSMLDAEKDYIKEVDRRLKIHLAEEKRRAAQAREQEKRRKEREREAREAAIAQEGEQARQDEWEALVKEGERRYWLQQGVPKSLLSGFSPGDGLFGNIDPTTEQIAAAHQFGQEWAALQSGVAGPSKSPAVQAHLRKLRQEVAKQRAQEPGRLSAVEIGDWQQPLTLAPAEPPAEPLSRRTKRAARHNTRTGRQQPTGRLSEMARDPQLTRPQAARELLVKNLRGQLQRAVAEERPSLLARLRRAEAALEKKDGAAKTSRMKPKTGSKAWKKRQRRQWEENRRYDLLSPTSTLRAPVGTRPRGRYSSPVAVEAPIRLPRDVVDRIDEQARSRALAELPPMPRGDGYSLAPMQAWREQFDKTYAPIRQALWAEAVATRRAERQSEEQRKRDVERYLADADRRFAELEIVPPEPTMTDEPALDPDTRFEQLETVDPVKPADDVVRDRFRDWYR